LGVSTSISLGNGMTPALQSMTRALNITIAAFQSMQNVSSQAVDTASLDAARQAMAEAEVHINNYESGLSEAGRQQTEFNQEIDRGASSANGLMGKIKGIVSAYAGLQSIKALVSASDQYAQIEARLGLVTSSADELAQVQNEIFASANRSRAAYTDTAAAVAKLYMLAGKAFSNIHEVVGFTELMNKNFVIGGASAFEQASSMYQLTQAMASGKLQGDEYKSILENAPLLAKSIEDYMINVQGAQGSMKDWASEGLLTAEVIKMALFNTADEVNEKIGKMPMTWGQVWTKMKNYANLALRPVLVGINWVANNISIIGPLVWGVATAFAFYAFVLGGYTIARGFANVADFIAEIQAYRTAKAMLAQVDVQAIAINSEYALAVATAQATVAQGGFNTVLLACPIAWIIFAIIALIAIFYAVIAVINKVKGTSISATGVIFGVFAWLAAAIFNMVVGVINASIQFLWTRFVEPFISIIEFILNVANGGFDSFGGAVANLIGQIISWFLSLGKIVTKIIDAIFGTNWTAGLSSLQNNVLSWGKNENAITLSREAPSIKSRIDMTDAYDAGYNFGQGIDNKVKGLFPTIPEYPVQDVTGLGYEMPGGTGLEDNVAQIADNTGGISDSLNISKEDLKYMRDVAEREAINRYTTAQISVDFKNTATINSEMDIDGVMNKFTEKLREAVDTSAEGVHYVV
jgi:tape measure domain